MNKFIIDNYYIDITDKINNMFPYDPEEDENEDETKHNKALERTINKLMSSKESQQALKVISDKTEWIKTQLMFWLPFIYQINLNTDIVEKEEYILTIIKRLIRTFKLSIIEFNQNKLNKICANTPFANRAVVSVYAKYIMEKMNAYILILFRIYSYTISR